MGTVRVCACRETRAHVGSLDGLMDLMNRLVDGMEWNESEQSSTERN